MKIIFIDGVIGWDVIPKNIKKEMDEAKGDNLRFDINSPGGFVTPGIAIANLIRDYSGFTETRILGDAASIASYIAQFGKKRTVYDNSRFMLHNASSFGGGDSRFFKKVSEHLERVTANVAKTYTLKSEKPIGEVRNLMDEESFFYGDEIVEHGFADEVIQTDKKGDKLEAKALLEESIKNCSGIMLKSEQKNYDLEKAAALLGVPDKKKKESDLNDPDKKKDQNKILNQQGEKMDLSELKEKHPGIFNQAVKEGFGNGVKNERERSEAHLIMGEASGDMKTAMAAIKDGTEMNDVCRAKYMAASMNKKIVGNMGDENPDLGDGNIASNQLDAEDQVANIVAKNCGVTPEKGDK